MPTSSESSPATVVVSPVLTSKLNSLFLALVLLGSALLAFATADSLVVVRGGLPLATDLAWAEGVLVLPSLVAYVVGQRARARQVDALLLVSAAAGIGSTIVGGTVGASSDATLVSGALAVVAWTLIDRPASETLEERRVRRHRVARGFLIVSIVAVLLAVALLGSYESLPPVHTLSSVALTNSADLVRGGSARQNLTANPGDFLIAEIGAPPSASPIVAEILAPGGAVVGRALPGTLQEPAILNITSNLPRGTYELDLSFPASASTNLTLAPVNWTYLDIPAADRAVGSLCVVTGILGGTLLLLAAVFWLTTRPPRPPLAPFDTPTAAPPDGAPIPSEKDPPAGTS